jgi:hypothetical protein
MNIGNISIRAFLVLCGMAVLFQPLQGLAQQDPSAATGGQQAATGHDGQHDFDFEIGSWKIHLKRLDKWLVGSTPDRI